MQFLRAHGPMDNFRVASDGGSGIWRAAGNIRWRWVKNEASLAAQSRGRLQSGFWSLTKMGQNEHVPDRTAAAGPEDAENLCRNFDAQQQSILPRIAVKQMSSNLVCPDTSHTVRIITMQVKKLDEGERERNAGHIIARIDCDLRYRDAKLKIH